ncbi:MAG: acetate--CoA ligase [Candidatus Micrarchaeota archaeon]
MVDANHKYDTYQKAGKLNFTPNMPNYEETYKSFKFEDHYNEIGWAQGKPLNAAHVAVERHANGPNANKTALIYVGDNNLEERYTYKELHLLSNKFANVLKKHGIKKGDRVFLFISRVPAVYVAFLGILKAGAIASTLFGAFGPQAVKDRVGASDGVMIITNAKLKERVDSVKAEMPALEHVIVVGAKEEMPGAISYEKEMESSSDEFTMEETHPEDTCFMLYTSGTTGKPKGVMHAHMAILQQHMTAKWVLDLRPEDVYWCTADHGWVTGISYGILGPLSIGTTIILYEGRFSADAWYSTLQKYKVNVWYTAPTAIRMLMKEGKEITKKYDFSSLRVIYSVGEPLNPEAIREGLDMFGLPFHDTWWQTETGAMMITNYPCMDIRFGSMGKPFPGVAAGIIDDNGNELGPNEEGNLALRPGWPAMMRTIWKNQEKYDSYFKNGWYTAGDKAWRDMDGYFWFIGRADDVIKTSGERVGPFEVESALIDHPAVAEAGVIGKPDPVRGEIIKAFITLKKGFEPSDKLKEEIQQFVKKRMAAHAFPREIDFVQNLPKTRSGKIMRRVLKAKELGQDVGDTSTLESD